MLPQKGDNEIVLEHLTAKIPIQENKDYKKCWQVSWLTWFINIKKDWLSWAELSWAELSWAGLSSCWKLDCGGNTESRPSCLWGDWATDWATLPLLHVFHLLNWFISVCSGPFGYSDGGTAFSDEDIAGGRHITAIKIRVGTEMNSIQVSCGGRVSVNLD